MILLLSKFVPMKPHSVCYIPPLTVWTQLITCVQSYQHIQPSPFFCTVCSSYQHKLCTLNNKYYNYIPNNTLYVVTNFLKEHC